MRRMLLIGTVMALVLAMAPPVSAKGPTGATITGPGIDEPIELGMTDEMLWTLAEQSGFNRLMFQHPAEPKSGSLKMPPVGDLGPNYVITFFMGDLAIPIEVYPHAPLGPIADSPDKPTGPLMQVSEGVDPAVFGRDDTMFTWYKPVAALNQTLLSIGVPLESSEATATKKVAEAAAKTPTAPTVEPAIQPTAKLADTTPATDTAPIAPSTNLTAILPIAVVAGAVLVTAIVGTKRRRRSLVG